MKTFLLILFLIICPMLLGMGIVSLSENLSSLKKKGSPGDSVSSGISSPGNKKRRFILFELSSLADSYSLGVLILLLIAGVSNFISYFLSLSVANASRLFAVLLIFVLTIGYFITMIASFTRFKATVAAGSAVSEAMGKSSASGAEGKSIEGSDKVMDPKSPGFPGPLIISLCIILSLIPVAYIIFSVPDFHGDQTLETVSSFLHTGQLFSVNPLTGLGYTGNSLPARVPYMCIPFFYTVLCNTFGCDAALLVWRIMPVFWLVAGYACFCRIGRVIFKDSPLKQHIFYAISVFMLISFSARPADIGYDAMYSGFRGISIAALVLTSWTVGTALKKKWFALILPVIIEPLITSTMIGLGACFAIGIGMLICELIEKRLLCRIKSKKGSASSGASLSPLSFSSYSSLLIYSVIMLVLIIIPPMAYLLGLGQTVFFSHDYIRICLPFIPAIAALLSDLTGYLKGRSKVISAFAVVISAFFIFVLGGFGSSKSDARNVIDPEFPCDPYESCIPVIDRLSLLSEEHEGGDYLVLAVPSLTQYIHLRTGSVSTVFGRDMWDGDVKAYNTEVCDDTTDDLYHWMLYNEYFGCVYYMQNDSVTDGLDYSGLDHAALDASDLYTGGGVRFAQRARELGIDAIVFCVKDNTDMAALSHIEQVMSASHEYIGIDSDVNSGYYILFL